MKFTSLPQYHAILLVSSNRTADADSFFSELRAISPAHRHFNQTVLDITSARDIISWAKTPYNGERVGLISFHTIGIPAQNALLKVLEEPPEKTRFILITSNKANLIDTVLSRVLHIDTSEHKEESLEDARHYLMTNPSERMKLECVLQLLAKTDEEDRKDREAVRAFILSITVVLSKNTKFSRFTTELFETANYASSPSSSGKALLEYLSLLLPQTKD